MFVSAKRRGIPPTMIPPALLATMFVVATCGLCASYTALQNRLRFGQQENTDDPIVCYVSQGPAASYMSRVETFRNNLRSGTYVFFYHSYDEDCDGCIFHKGTSYAQGKNLVMKAALQSGHTCKYVTVLDDDVVLLETDSPGETGEAWRRYHEMLLADETQYPIVKARDSVYDTEVETVYQTCVDEHLQSFRLDYLPLAYPVPHDNPEYLWLSNEMQFAIMSRCFPSGILVDGRFTSHNVDHRYSAESQQKNATRNVDVLARELPSLGPWNNHGALAHRCTVTQAPSIDWHPRCASALTDRFNKWLNAS